MRLRRRAKNNFCKEEQIMPDGYDDIDRQDLEKYEQLSDDEVALLAQGGDGQALVYLLDKYKNFVRARARSYFLIGADHEDIVQEGMIGLYKACLLYPSRCV